MKKQVSFNGKFLSASPTGVHRVAHQLIAACDTLLAERNDDRKWRIVKPRDAHGQLATSVISQQTVGHLTWQIWEQFELPRETRGDILVNLCNLAPISADGITMIHDAQVFISPKSYSLPFRRWYQYALPRIGRHSRHILTVSDYSKDMLVQYGIAPAEKISVIHNGIDHIISVEKDDSILYRLDLHGKSFVCALANIQHHKNIKILLEAFASKQLGDVQLVLFGGADEAAFKAAGLSAPKNVVWAGSISDAQMRALFEAAVCLAFPSLTEGFGFPPLEAMSVGCPAIVAPCGALPEVCGEAAIYAAPHDARAWVDAIDGLITSSDALVARRARGAIHAQAFTWRRSAQRLLSILDHERS